VAIAIVLCAVFIPTALVSGITGQFYKQFALTIAVATLISAFNSLTLSPAMAALLLKGHHAKKDVLTRLIEKLLGWFFRAFNRGFDRTGAAYSGVVRRLVRFSALSLIVYAGLLVLTGFGFRIVPTGFIPSQDVGYLIAVAQLPDGASLQRTEEVRAKLSEIARSVPGVENTVEITGLSILDSTNRSNALTMFLPLQPFSVRAGKPELSNLSVLRQVQAKASAIREAFVLVIPPPPVRGIGTAGGFKMQIEDRSAGGVEALQQAVNALIAAGMKEPGLTQFFTSFRTQVPQIYLDIDRDKVEAMNVDLSSVFSTLQASLGASYVNDMTFLNRTYQVKLQADAQFRIRPDQIKDLYVRNAAGGMVPMGTIAQIREINGPDKIMHYNIYPSAEVNGNTLPGVSSGQAVEKMQRLAKEVLPTGFDFEWTELTLQEVLAGNTAAYIFPLCVLFVFLALAAQYESWSLPMAIILIVPMCLLSALIGVWLRGFDNNIFTQIAFVVLVGLACKNAILIVEFAKQQQDEGKDRVEAAIEAAHLRLRPILMTSFAFILGVFPLVIAKGAGAEMRQVLGTAVFAGMIGVTIFGIFLTPVFYSVIMKFFGKKAAPAAEEPPAGVSH